MPASANEMIQTSTQRSPRGAPVSWPFSCGQPPSIHVGILVAWRPSRSLLDPHTWEVTAPPPPGAPKAPQFHEHLGVTMERKRSCPGGRGRPHGQGCRREITRWPRLPGT